MFSHLPTVFLCLLPSKQKIPATNPRGNPTWLETPTVGVFTFQVKGYGFIACEAFPDQDVFVLKSELPQGPFEGCFEKWSQTAWKVV